MSVPLKQTTGCSHRKNKPSPQQEREVYDEVKYQPLIEAILGENEKLFVSKMDDEDLGDLSKPPVVKVTFSALNEVVADPPLKTKAKTTHKKKIKRVVYVSDEEDEED